MTVCQGATCLPYHLSVGVMHHGFSTIYSLNHSLKICNFPQILSLCLVYFISWPDISSTDNSSPDTSSPDRSSNRHIVAGRFVEWIFSRRAFLSKECYDQTLNTTIFLFDSCSLTQLIDSLSRYSSGFRSLFLIVFFFLVFLLSVSLPPAPLTGNYTLSLVYRFI